jgi:hypothetical protein
LRLPSATLDDPRWFRLDSAIRSGLVLTCLLLVAHAGPLLADCDELDPVDLLPGNGACLGVTLDGEPMTAYTPSELYALINGGAQIYFDHGWVATALQNYSIDVAGQPVPATLKLFNQGTEANATALYDELLSIGIWEPIPDWLGSGVAHYRTELFSITLQFREACFVSDIIVLSTEPAALAAARCLGETTAALIQGQSPVDGTTWGHVKATYR